MIVSLLLALIACGTDVQVAPDEESMSTQDRLQLSDAEAAAILDFLNDCDTTLAELDDDVGLDADAAEALVDHRDGGDDACGTADDAPYATLDEVDAVPQVGDQTILAILAWLQGGGTPDTGGDDGVWEGVAFSDAEQAVVLEIANEATYDQLDVDVGLASDEATNIVDARPIDTMDELAAVPQVGASALQKLKDFVPSWDG